MKRATMILGLSLLLLGLESAIAKPLPKVAEGLKLKFEKGNVYYLEVTTKTSQKMKVMQQDVNQEQDQTVVIQISPESRTAYNDWIVGVCIVGLRLKIDIGGNVIEYDSTKNQAASPVAPVYAALLKGKLRATIAPHGELRRLDGREELVAGLANLPAGQDGLMKSILSEAALKKMFMPIGEYLPDRAERVGAHWNRQGQVDLGAIGRYIYDHKYSYHDTVGQVHEIRAQTTMKYEAPNKNDPALPFVITGIKMKKSDGNGVYKFDADRGRLQESTQEARFAATMTIRVGNMDSEVDIDQTQTTKVRSLDRNPMAPK